MIRLNRRLISATVSGISPGSGGGGWSGRVGSGAGGRWRVAGGCCGGGDRADGEGGHGQHGVAQQGGVAADLGVVESEVVLAELEVLLDWPAQACHPDQCHQRDRPPGWDVAVVVGQFPGGEVFADEQGVSGVGGGDPGPGVGAFALGPGH